MSLNAGQFSSAQAVTVTINSAYPVPIEYEGQTSVAITAAQIWWIQAEGSGAVMRIESQSGPGGSKDILHVTQSAASIATAGGVFASCTQTGGQAYDWPSGAFYFNTAFFQGVISATSGAFLTLGTKMANDTINVSDTAAAIIARVNAVASSAPPIPSTVALAGNSQGTAAAIALVAGAQNDVTLTGADDVKGGGLPAATAGLSVRLYNNSANRTALVYPAVGGFIEGNAVNVPLSIPAGVALDFNCFVAGTWQVQDVPRATQTVIAIGSVTGDAAPFALQEGTDNLVLVTGADGVKGVRFVSVGAADTTTGTVRNLEALVLFVYPPTGLDFGAGADVPISVEGNSILTFSVDGADIFVNQSAFQVNANQFKLTKQANTGYTGVTNPAIDTAALTAGANDVLVAAPALVELRVPGKIYEEEIGTTAASPGPSTTGNLLDVVITLASPNNIIQVPTSVNFVTVLNQDSTNTGEDVIMKSGVITVVGAIPSKKSCSFAKINGAWLQVTPYTKKGLVLVAGTVTHPLPAIKATSVVTPIATTVAGTQGILSYSIVAGTSVTITSSDVADVSTVDISVII